MVARRLVRGAGRLRSSTLQKRRRRGSSLQERDAIERFFDTMKQFRRVATRYDELLANFMGFAKLAAIAIWLR